MVTRWSPPRATRRLLDDLDVRAAPRARRDRSRRRSAPRSTRPASSTRWSTTPRCSGAGPMEDFPLDRLQSIIDTNTYGPLRLAQALIPAWRERGSGVIVNVSSVQGRVVDTARGRVRSVEVRARGALGDAALRARALRHPRRDHRARIHRAGHEGITAPRRSGRVRRAVGAVERHRREGHRPDGASGTGARRCRDRRRASRIPTRRCASRWAATPR